MIDAPDGVQIIDGIPVWGEADAKTLQQIKRCAESAEKVALMADAHLGYGVPIGGVVAYKDAISPSGVGYDIACGNKAVLTDMPGSEARAKITTIMDDIAKTISFGMGRRNQERVDHPLFDDLAWTEIRTLNLRDKAAAQLGTVGSGNHYIDVLVDEQDRVWVGVHFGSRGLGHDIAQWTLKAAGAQSNHMDAPPVVIREGSDLFDTYLAAMTLAGRYAYAGRDWVCQKVTTEILGAKILTEVHNNHNFAWREIHDNEWMWVVRKGATPAFPGQRGFVGGTMGDKAVILEGVDATKSSLSVEAAANILGEQELAMYSTVHGAGRTMSRTVAAGKVKKGRLVSPGILATQYGIHDSWELGNWLKRERGVILRGGGLDEAPQAYKNLDTVLQHHQHTIKVVHTMLPIGVAMASPDTRDDYKD